MMGSHVQSHKKIGTSRTVSANRLGQLKTLIFEILDNGDALRFAFYLGYLFTLNLLKLTCSYKKITSKSLPARLWLIQLTNGIPPQLPLCGTFLCYSYDYY